MGALRPTEINTNIFSFCVARDFVLLAIGLRYPFDMEHPMLGLNSPCRFARSDFVSLNRNSLTCPCTQWKMPMSTAVSRESALPGAIIGRQGNRVYSLHEVVDGLGNQKGKGGVIVIRANLLAIVREPDPSLQNIRRPPIG